MREHTVTTTKGSVLTAVEDGDPRGRPVFSLHGSPGGRLLYPRHVADASRKGIRLIGYDRPGYGGSTAVRGRSVGDTAADVAAIADALGIERFGVWGHSGGGAPALACAALLPDRVVAASSLAGVAPYDAPGLDFTAGMGELNREEFQLMLSDPAAWETKLEQDVVQLLQAKPEEILEMWKSLVSDVDLRAITPDLMDFLKRQGGEGLAPGGAGLRDDNLSDLRPWGFDLDTVRVPVQIWHGQHDRFVPFSHGQWLAARLPRSEAHLEPDEGHISLYQQRIPEVHAWILSHF
jgi:pimeloyl-ACP methyl ester carboxylesterase